MGQLDGSGAVEKLRRSIGRHILELDSTVETASHCLRVASARTVPSLELTICKYLAVKERHVVGRGTRETLVRV